MIRTQIQFPDPLYRRLKDVAESQDWSLAEVVRRASEHYVERFPRSARSAKSWAFPVRDFGGDYLVDPAGVDSEAEAIESRST